MRTYSEWVTHTRDRYLKALEQLEADDKTAGRDDLPVIAAASAIVYAMLSETNVHENEMLKHIYRLHGQDLPTN